jgi:septal ring factor EnvC (AmiA/AmiB activator)
MRASIKQNEAIHDID